jgi:hypothetical protein
LCNCICGGKSTPTWSYNFIPLFSLDEKQKAELDRLQADTDRIHIDSGIIAPEEARKRIAADPNSRYGWIDVNDVPNLKEEEAGGLIPGGAGKGGGLGLPKDILGGSEDEAEADEGMTESAWNSLLKRHHMQPTVEDVTKDIEQTDNETVAKTAEYLQLPVKHESDGTRRARVLAELLTCDQDELSKIAYFVRTRKRDIVFGRPDAWQFAKGKWTPLEKLQFTLLENEATHFGMDCTVLAQLKEQQKVASDVMRKFGLQP